MSSEFAEQFLSLAHVASELESQNPVAAAMAWRDSLKFIPADSPQAAAIHARIGALSAGIMPPSLAPVQNPPRVRAAPRDDNWQTMLLKTGGSIALSVAIYSWLWNLQFAAGFVLLIFIHELGHVVAMRYYRLHASPPIFIPFVGALINLREPPPNAKVEAVVGIGGPIAGTLAALLCYAVYLHTGAPIILLLAFFGFLMNLFNLLPVPPLDGGRVTAAVSPWLWMPGLLAVAAKIVYDLLNHRGPDILLIVLLFYAWPRIRATLLGRARHGAYYQISRLASWTMGAAYVALAGLLIFCMWQAGQQLPPDMRVGF